MYDGSQIEKLIIIKKLEQEITTKYNPQSDYILIRFLKVVSELYPLITKGES